jgi:L-2-hydroxyglutarate oxidase
MKTNYDYIIIGSGIIGLTIAHTLKARNPQKSILIIDKEHTQAFHASSRNSGVLHAGFYYTANSLKAKLTVEGNHALKAYCKEKDIRVNTCGKLVVAQNKQELAQLYELEKRGEINGSNVKIIDQEQAEEFEPNVKTFQKALYSPDTASVNPAEVCLTLKEDLEATGVKFLFQTKYLGQKDGIIKTSSGDFNYKKLINCAGLYADKIANDFGFGKKYTMIPFKGLYLKYTKNKTDIKTNIYPVPNLKNPFLGVHYTKTVDNDIKIGPTAIPAFWRENYDSFARFDLKECLEVMGHETKLFLTNAFGFRNLAFEEIRKYNKDYLVAQAQLMVKEIDPKGFTTYTKPGIRAQLLDKKASKLVQDFVIEADNKTIHILNAVSPAFTCSFPFANLVVNQYIEKNT